MDSPSLPWFASIFSYSVGRLFLLFIVSFAVQKAFQFGVLYFCSVKPTCLFLLNKTYFLLDGVHVV